MASRRVDILSGLVPLLIASAVACTPVLPIADPDVNDDGVVNILDASLVGSCISATVAQACICRRADADLDGDIDLDDLNFVADAFDETGFPIVAPDTVGPIVTIETPGDLDVFNMSLIPVKGRVSEPLFSLFVNGIEANLSTGDEPQFSTEAELPEGESEIEVRATDLGCNETVATVRVVQNTQDVTAPRVELISPVRVQAGAVVLATALASDNVGVSEVEFTFDGLLVSTLTSEPFEIEYNAPGNGVGALEIQALARDAAGNEGIAMAMVLISTAPDDQPPIIESLLIPQSAAPGDDVTALAIVSDEGGVAEVRFAIEGEQVAIDDSPPYEVVLSIPAAAPIDTLLAVGIEVVDTSGNTASEQSSIQVVDVSDTTPPAPVSVQAPAEALPGQVVQITGAATDAGGIQKVVFIADGVDIAEDNTAPYAFEFDVPSTAVPGTTTLWTLRAVDFAGNASESDPVSTRIVSPGGGLIAGEVYDDATGLPLSGALVQLLETGGETPEPPVEAVTDIRGRYRLSSAEGIVRLRISAEGYTEVDRTQQVERDRVAVPLDARLTPRATAEPVMALAGGSFSLDGQEVVVDIAVGALATDGFLALTPLGGQGLPASLPLGWSTVRALEIVSERPFNTSIALSAHDLFRAEELIAVQWDPIAGHWMRLEASNSSDDSLGVTVPRVGSVALVRPDDAPQPPPIPAIGEVLMGVRRVPLPADASVVMLPSPRVLFLEPDARSKVTARLESATPLPSGTPIEVEFTEFYDRTDGTQLLPEPSAQDFLLYQTGTGPESRFVASPSQIFDPALLDKGAITLAAQRAGLQTARALIGSGGGSLATASGDSIAIPAGAFTQSTPVAIVAVEPDESGLAGDPVLEVAAGVRLDLGGAVLATSAELVVEVAGLAPGGQVLVVQAVSVLGVTRHELVSIAERDGDMLRANSGALGLSLPGIRSEGRYFFVRLIEPVGFATGQLLAGVGPVADGLIGTDTLPFVSRTDATAPTFVVPARLGTVTIAGLDLTDGATANASTDLATAGEILTMNLLVAIMRPVVVSVEPADGAAGVPARAVVSARFSRPMDASSLNDSTFALNEEGGGAVSGRLTLSANRLRVDFEPDEALAGETAHIVVLTPGLRDVFGNALLGAEADESFRARFTSADTTPPPQPDAGQIDVGTPEGGVLSVTGSQGTVEPNTSVSVENRTTGAVVATLAGADGSFALAVLAALLDDLELRIVDASGNETIVALGRPPPPVGVAVLGEDGGLVEGEGGLGAVIPASVLPPDTIVSVTPADIEGLIPPFSDELPGFVAGALDIDIGGVEIPNVLELQLEVDGIPGASITDRVPLFDVRRTVVVPAGLSPGEVLRIRALASDEFRQSSELVVEIPISTAPDTSPRTETRPGMPVVSITVPTEAAPGSTIEIRARAEPANIKLRFPADPGMTGDEQILIWDVREIGGEVFWNLADQASLKILPDGSRVIETTSPPYRGVRRDTERLVAIVYLQATLSFIQVLTDTVQSSSAGLAGAMIAQSGAFIEAGAQIAAGVSLIENYSRPRPVDLRTYEFAVVPAISGVPNTLTVVDGRTNAILYTKEIEALPPDTFSGVVVFGEDDNDLRVTSSISLATGAVPLDAGISVGFSHLIETGSITGDSLFIMDGAGEKVPSRLVFQEREDERIFAVLVRPLQRLRAGTQYTLVATTAITRPGTTAQPGLPLGDRFELAFTTAEPAALIGSVDISGANTFDRVGDRLVVTRKDADNNSFVVVDLSDPSAPTVVDEVELELQRRGPIRAITAMENASFTGSNGLLVEGDLALVTAGDTRTFSALRVYSLESSPPELLSGTLVGAPTDIILQTAELLVIPIFGHSGNIETIEVSDPFSTSLNGIPKTPAIPWRVESDGDHTAYFVNQGIGVMTIDLTRAVPPPPVSERGTQFGPSFFPEDKAGAVVIRDDPSLIEENDAFSINSPSHLAFEMSPVEVSGAIVDSDVERILVNGFEAEIALTSDGLPTSWKVDIPLREGPNEVVATGFGGDGTDFGNARIVVIDLDSPNTLEGPGTVSINLPPIEVVGSGTNIPVTASVTDLVRFDQIFVNGILAAEKNRLACDNRRKPEFQDCGWSGSGTVMVPLEIGANTVVATAIDVDDEFLDSGASFQDMRLEESLVVTARAGVVTLFDASGLVPITRVKVPEGAFRVTLARKVSVDIDDDGRFGLTENADGDDVTVFDQRKNLVLAGGGSTEVLSFIDITEPRLAEVIGSLDLGAAVYRGAELPGRNQALIATAKGVVVVDLTRAHLEFVDEDGNGVDDRILDEIPLPGARDIEIDLERGLAYVLQRNEGIAVLSLAACAQDYGIDVSRVSIAQELRSSTLDAQRTALLEGIDEGLAQPACSPFKINQGTALFSQGSSACIWRADGLCSTAYKPGLSDYDFELIVPDGDSYEASLECAAVIDKKIKEQPLLREADVSVFVHPRSTLEKAYRDVRPVNGSCGAGSDRFGDLCLATNGLFLKWLLEGEFVRDGNTAYNDGLSFDGLLDILRSPITADSVRVDPITAMSIPILIEDAEPEPSHVPRLEGIGWACLQDFSLNASGARIRVKGEGLGDVPVQWPFYVKEIHKVAKAGIRTVYGKLLSSREGNSLMLESTRAEYQSTRGCLTQLSDPDDPNIGIDDFTLKRCETFEEFVASQAIRSVQRSLDVLSTKEALLAYQMFRRKSDVGMQIRDEEKANEFIIDVMNFIDDVRDDPTVKSAFDETVDNFTDAAVRKSNLNNCESDALPLFKPELGAEELEFKIPARLFNGGFEAASSIDVAFFHDGVEEKRVVAASLRPGESRFFESKSFKVTPFLSGVHSVEFLADTDARYSEYDKGNNFDGLFYYVLYPGSQATPPETSGDRPESPVEIPDPPASEICLDEGEAPPSPAIELIALGGGQREIAVEAGGTVELEWIVRNNGNVDLNGLFIEDSLAGMVSVGSVAVGTSKRVSMQFQVPNAPSTLLGLSTVLGLDDAMNGVGPVSASIRISVRDPIGGPAIRILSPPSSIDRQDPGNDKPWQTAAELIRVSGIVHSALGRPSVEVNGIVATVTGMGPDFEFETPMTVPLDEGSNTLIATAIDSLGAVDDDEVSLIRQPMGGLRVINLVNGQERARVQPGDTVEYSVRIVNDGPGTVNAITVVALHACGRTDTNADGSIDESTTCSGSTFEQLPPFDLDVGGDKVFEHTYDVPLDSTGGYIENEIFAVGYDGNGVAVGPIRDRAELWIGGLILMPDMIMLGSATEDAPVEKQLEVIRAADGVNVSETSTGTSYQVLDSSFSPLTQKMFEEFRKAIKNDQGKPFFASIPVATLEIDAGGKLVATENGIAVVRATHRSESTNGVELQSNFAVVIVGMAKVSSIEFAPRSAISLAIQAGEHLTNVIERRLLSTDDKNMPGPGERFGDTRSPPMILATTGALGCTGVFASKATNWIARHGYAELVTIKFDFLGGTIRGVDVLKAARELLETIPPIQVGPVPVPIGWILGRLLTLTATQFVDFRTDPNGVVSVTNGFPYPSGIVSVKENATGIGKVTGSLDLRGLGFGEPVKSDFLVIVLPKIRSTELRLDPTELSVGEIGELHAFAKAGFDQVNFEIELPIGELAAFVDPDLPDPAQAYIDRLLPGGFPGTLGIGPVEVPVIRDRPEDPNNLFSLRFKVGFQGNTLSFTEIELGFRTLGFMNELKIENPDVAGLLGQELFRTAIEVEGEAPGVTHLSVETCVPFLGDPVFDEFQGQGGGARITVDLLPTANPATVSIFKNQRETITLTGVDPGGDPLFFDVVGSPSDGALGPIQSINDTSVKVDYTPDTDFIGTDSFDFTVTDGTDTSRIGTISISVNNRPPVASFQSLAPIAQGTLLNGLFMLGDDLDGDPLSIKVITDPSNGVLLPDPLPAPTQVGNSASLPFSYQPDPTFSGVDTALFEVDDGTDTDQLTMTFTVNTPPVGTPQVTTVPPPQPIPNLVAQGGQLPIVVEAIDSDGDELRFQIVSQPASCAMAALGATNQQMNSPRATVEVMVTALQSCSGPFSFELVANDPLDVSAPFRIDFYVNEPPVATDMIGTRRLLVQEGQSNQNLRLEGNDPDGQSLGYDVPAGGGQLSDRGGALPGQSLPETATNPSFRNVNYTPPQLPPPSQSAEFIDTFEFVVTDGTDESDPGRVEIKVNRQPIGVPDSATTDEEQAVTIDVLANDIDPDGDSSLMTVTGVTQTQFATVTTDGQTVTYLPSQGFSDETDFFEYEVTDEDGGIAQVEVRVRVEPTNEDPDAVVDNYETDEDVPLFLDVLANDTDPDGDTLSVQSQTSPGLGIAQNMANGILYSPDPDENGVDVFTYVVNDGEGGSDSALVSVLIRPVNDDPVARDDLADTDEEQSVMIDVLFNDDDVDDDTLTITAFDQGANGSVTTVSGSLVYDPDVDFEGSDSFGYTISDGEGGSDSARVNVTIQPENDPPVARPDSAETDEDESVTVPVLGNDDDVDGSPDPSTVRVVANPSGGTVTVDPSGTITYTPNPGTTGTDSFAYVVTDDRGDDSSPATVTIDINARPVIPNLSRTGICCLEIVFDVAGSASDADGQVDRGSVQVGVLPANGTVSLNATTGVVIYRPNLLFVGSDTFSASIADDDGARSNPATLTAVVGAIVSGFPLINEVVSNPSQIEIFNAGAVAIDVTDWEIAGYTIGTDPLRETYVGPVVGNTPTSRTVFQTGAYLVIDLTGLGDIDDVVRLFDDGGTERDSVDTVDSCYVDPGLPSLARRVDGFSTNNDCTDFIRVEPPTLGASN